MLGKKERLKKERSFDKQSNKEKLKIGILSYPSCEEFPNTIPLAHLIDIFNEITTGLFVILGKSEYPYYKKNYNTIFRCITNYKIHNDFIRILKEIWIQIKISYHILRVNSKVRMWVFFIGGDALVLPMITAKLIRRKVILLFGGSTIEVGRISNDYLVFGLQIQSKINCMMSDKIILYSKIFVNDYHLEKWVNKISIAHEHTVNFLDFNITKNLNKRSNLIGYIGRFSEEKGILNLLSSIPEILKVRNDFKVILLGDGKAKSRIENYILDAQLFNTVKIEGWVPHEKLPDYLNELKLLVLPSYSEGLPNILLEAMACGTPVLATSVGAIPDIIKDGETGFLLENNSPECIATHIQNILNRQDFDLIATNATKLVKNEFTFQSAVKRFEQICRGV